MDLPTTFISQHAKRSLPLTSNCSLFLEIVSFTLSIRNRKLYPLEPKYLHCYCIVHGANLLSLLLLLLEVQNSCWEVIGVTFARWMFLHDRSCDTRVSHSLHGCDGGGGIRDTAWENNRVLPVLFFHSLTSSDFYKTLWKSLCWVASKKYTIKKLPIIEIFFPIHSFFFLFCQCSFW